MSDRLHLSALRPILNDWCALNTQGAPRRKTRTLSANVLGATWKVACVSVSAFDQKAMKPAVSSRPGEFHPQSLTEPDLTLSRRPALLRLAAVILRFIASVPPIAG